MNDDRQWFYGLLTVYVLLYIYCTTYWNTSYYFQFWTYSLYVFVREIQLNED